MKKTKNQPKKMKKIVFILMSFLILSCTKEEESPFKGDGLIRTIKVVNSDKLKDTRDQFFFYNDDDSLKRILGFNTFAGEYEYDLEGNLSKITSTVTSSLTKTTTFEYNEENKLISVTELANDVAVSDPLEFSYENNTISILDVREGAILDIKVELTLDTEGRVITKKTFNGNDSDFDLISEKKFNYNTLGNVVSVLETDYLPTETSKSTNYNYETLKNPYYGAYSEIFKSIYPWLFFSNIEINNRSGITPNIVKDANISYKRNNDLPTEGFNRNDGLRTEFNYY
ncbi:hypothetical protein [Wenyingzhuangia sp. IMCC45574]